MCIQSTLCYFVSNFIVKNFKYTPLLKELGSEFSYTHHLHSTINILLYLFCDIFIHASSLFSNQSKLQASKYIADISSLFPKYFSLYIINESLVFIQSFSKFIYNEVYENKYSFPEFLQMHKSVQPQPLLLQNIFIALRISLKPYQVILSLHPFPETNTNLIHLTYSNTLHKLNNRVSTFCIRHIFIQHSFFDSSSIISIG